MKTMKRKRQQRLKTQAWERERGVIPMPEGCATEATLIYQLFIFFSTSYINKDVFPLTSVNFFGKKQGHENVRKEDVTSELGDLRLLEKNIKVT